MKAADVSAPPQIEAFVARQPIFRADRTVAAYELLFRSGSSNLFAANVDPEEASTRVLSSAIDVFGLDALTLHKPALVQVAPRVLIDGQYACWPANRLVIELSSSTEPDFETIAACTAAKAAGYSIAIDGYANQPALEPLLAFTDLVSVHYPTTPAPTRIALVKRFANSPTRLLAKRIETSSEFEEARAIGYREFQGPFFCKPELLRRQDIPVSKGIYLQFLRELSRPRLDYARIEQVIKQDVGLSVKLLRYLNSASFGWRAEISSIKHALAMLGERPFRRWVSLLLVAVTSADRPPELLTTCLTRARFCELLAADVGLTAQELDLFLVGLLSLMDTLVGRPLPELLADMAVPPQIAEAFANSGPASRLRQVLQLVIAYEDANWEVVDAICTRLSLTDPIILPQCYQAALVWAAEAAPG